MSTITSPTHVARPGSWLARALIAFGLLAVLAVLGLVTLLLAAHQTAWAAGVLAALCVAVLIHLSPRLYAWRYVLPGLLAVAVFIVLPLAYTLAISFTNYSSTHLLAFERATQVLLARYDSEGLGMAFELRRDGDQRRLVLQDDQGQHFVSPPFKAPVLGTAAPTEPLTLLRQTAEEARATPGQVAGPRELVAERDLLAGIALIGADGRTYRQASLHRFIDQKRLYVQEPDGRLRGMRDNSLLSADMDAGFWRRADGSALEPGFRSSVGWDNYRRIFGDEKFLQPFLRVFAWTVTFAGLNTLLTFALGLVLAVAMNWDALKGRSAYRLGLFLPYAVPAFISIPVFRGLFNENLGEINLVLDMLFGVRPGWFSDATLARSMVLVVNTWLGYPYMMILAMGLIKAIPEELYEASALAGAGPLTNFFRITLPLIARPIAPLLVASFAANFNNLTLIALLTEGAPDFLDTDVPAGATDLLASYTYRIAFQDGGQNYALACAISSLVFLIVAGLAIVNLRLFKQKDAAR
ncbi:MAG: maltose ABC transporter permease MalF [Burkholderiales bacterium PBB6]|nr:MAG: maltose ABC transporter permease MalF [Burkholderiales bacterium PBB6]